MIIKTQIKNQGCDVCMYVMYVNVKDVNDFGEALKWVSKYEVQKQLKPVRQHNCKK